MGGGKSRKATAWSGRGYRMSEEKRKKCGRKGRQKGGCRSNGRVLQPLGAPKAKASTGGV